MHVGQLLQELSSGELRNLNMSNGGTGAITEADKDRLVVFANRALSRIFTRFVARRMFVPLVQRASTKTYAIQVEHAVSDTTVGNTADRYLQDTADMPFTDRLIKIIAVRPAPTEDVPEPANLLINDANAYASDAVRMTAYDELRFELPVEGAVYELELQMDHPRLSIPPNENQRINVPPMLMEALQVKIAADVYSSMNGEANIAKARELDAKFEGLVQLVDNLDILQNSTTFSNDRLFVGGFL